MSNPHILVVDDEPKLVLLVRQILSALGYQISAASSGEQALESVAMEQPDLVILDVMMPKIDDGIQTYEQFRTDQKLSHIPIIMLSAIAKKTFVHSIRMLRPRRDARIPEPEAYMEKPPDADELGKLISELLPSKH